MTKLHMVSTGVSEKILGSDRPFKVPRLVTSSIDRQDSVNQSQLNQLESKGVSTSQRSKRSPSVVAEQIRKIYNVVHRDEVDDAIADFLWQMEFHLMLLIQHITKK